jgi:hypothetical protein
MSARIDLTIPKKTSFQRKELFPDLFDEDDKGRFAFTKPNPFAPEDPSITRHTIDLAEDSGRPGKSLPSLISHAARKLPNVHGSEVSIKSDLPKSFIKEIKVSKVRQGGMNPVEKIIKAAGKLVKTAVGGRRRRAHKKTRKVSRR